MTKQLERKTITIDGYFDLETEHWDRYVVGGYFDRHRHFTPYPWTDEDALADRIISSEGHIWAHNGGKYDTLWLLERFLKRYTDKAEVFLAGQRIVCLKIGKTEIRDSLALVPMALEKAAEIGGIPKAKTGLDCECGKACGGYCAIRRSMKPVKLQQLISYLKVDCQAGFEMLVKLSIYAEENDLDLCSTIGASSWRTARRWAKLPVATWEMPGVGATKAYHFCAKGYFGGRTQVFRPRSEKGYHCDVNSAYIHALRTLELPVGEMRELGPSKVESAYRAGKEGVYQARVRVPDMHIPPLPLRGRHRIYYPTGNFAGVWTGNELRYAESVGVRIEGIKKGIVWPRKQNLFKGFCEELWRLRDQAGVKTALGQWLKWFGNSLTGKLAQNPLSEKIDLNLTDPIFCPADLDCHGVLCPEFGGEECCPHGCTKLCGRHTALNKDQTIWSSMEWTMPTCGHVHWAAYLTAHQRTYLHAQLTDGGGDDAVYCDTDSCFSERLRRRGIGGALGQWKDEGRYRLFHSIAPKTYTYFDEDDNREAKAKGIYKPEENWHKIEAGEPIGQDRGVKSLKSAIADGGPLFARKNIVRRVKEPEPCDICHRIHIGDRILDGDLTRPMNAASILEHESR